MRERRPSTSNIIGSSTPRPNKPAPQPTPGASLTLTSASARDLTRELERARVQDQAPRTVAGQLAKPKLPSSPSPRRSMPPSLESAAMARAAVAAAQLSRPPPPPGAPMTPRAPPPPFTASLTPAQQLQLPPPPPPLFALVCETAASVDVDVDDTPRIMQKKITMLELELENLEKRLAIKDEFIERMKAVHARTEKQLEDKLAEALRTIKILQAVGQFQLAQ
jgi:hypothetical protein